MTHYLSRLEEAIRKNWDKPALCNYGGEEFKFRDVASYIEKFHIFFELTGTGKGEHISLCARNSARWAICFFAINTYGAVAVPILSDFTPESIDHIVDHSESTVLFTDKEIWERLDIGKMPRLKAVVAVNDFTLVYYSSPAIKEAFEKISEAFTTKFPMGFSSGNLEYPTDNENDLAVINYTSGTTSAPKGVMLKYGNFSATVDFASEKVTPGEDNRLVSMLPMGHIYGLVIELIFPLCSGCTIYYLGKTPSPTLLLKAMKDIKPFMVVTVPLVMEKVYKSSIKPAISRFPANILIHIPVISHFIYKKIGIRLHEAFGGRAHHYIMGGAAFNPEVEKVFRKIKLPYLVGYGMTEAAPLLAYEQPWDYVPGSCGKAVACCDIRIDSEDPRHIAGEIQAKGANICCGYFKNAEANENAFTEDGYLRTGDLGIMDKDGNIFIKGRCKTMILSANGQNIYPEEVEAVINSQDYVSESVVVDRNGKLVALVYLDRDAIRRDGLDGETVSDIPENILINSNRNLPNYSRLTKVEIVLVPFEKTPKMSIKRFLYK